MRPCTPGTRMTMDPRPAAVTPSEARCRSRASCAAAAWASCPDGLVRAQQRRALPQEGVRVARPTRPARCCAAPAPQQRRSLHRVLGSAAVPASWPSPAPSTPRDGPAEPQHARAKGLRRHHSLYSCPSVSKCRVAGEGATAASCTKQLRKFISTRVDLLSLSSSSATCIWPMMSSGEESPRSVRGAEYTCALEPTLYAGFHKCPTFIMGARSSPDGLSRILAVRVQHETPAVEPLVLTLTIRGCVQ